MRLHWYNIKSNFNPILILFFNDSSLSSAIFLLNMSQNSFFWCSNYIIIIIRLIFIYMFISVFKLGTSKNHPWRNKIKARKCYLLWKSWNILWKCSRLDLIAIILTNIQLSTLSYSLSLAEFFVNIILFNFTHVSEISKFLEKNRLLIQYQIELGFTVIGFSF